MIVTGRGGVGNVRAPPLKLDVTSMSHPQTASILAQHEAANDEYEKQVLRRNREIKANTPRASGRGGIGNITETNPKSTTKPLRRASLFRGGGAGISPLSPPSDILDMNVYDEAERRQYAQKNIWRRRSSTTLSGPGSGANSPLSPDSEYSGSDKTSGYSISIRSMSTSNFAVTEPFSSPTSPSGEKHPISALWSKVVRSNSRQRSSRRKQQDLLASAAIVESENPRLFNDHDHKNVFPDFAGDPIDEQVSITGYAI